MGQVAQRRGGTVRTLHHDHDHDHDDVGLLRAGGRSAGGHRLDTQDERRRGGTDAWSPSRRRATGYGQGAGGRRSTIGGRRNP